MRTSVPGLLAIEDPKGALAEENHRLSIVLPEDEGGGRRLPALSICLDQRRSRRTTPKDPQRVLRMDERYLSNSFRLAR
jgi:hypothetical protein